MAEKKDIEKLIVQNKKSNLKNHWNDSFFYNTTKYSGEIKQNELLIWRSSHFLRGVYPIFHLTFDQNDKLKGIKTEKNPYHKLLSKITIGVLIVFISSLFLLFDFKPAIIGTIVILFILALLILVLGKSRKYETKLLTVELKEAIENIEHLNNPDFVNKPKSESKKEKVKEWTFTKVLTRFLIYPFCLFILWVSITGFLPQGKILYGIFGIVIASAYPIADILLILGKNKNS
ncbi:hypothetical protein [Aquimarina rhabdastrellae]